MDEFKLNSVLTPVKERAWEMSFMRKLSYIGGDPDSQIMVKGFQQIRGFHRSLDLGLDTHIKNQEKKT